MIQDFKSSDIYQVKWDVLGVGIQDIRFIVYALPKNDKSRPSVIGRVALAYNTMVMPDEIYEMAEHIRITPVLLFYLGFEVAESLPGTDGEYHFVKYLSVKGMPEMIQLVPEGNGYVWLKMNDEGLFENEYQLEYLDELQDIFREKYQSENPLRLEEVNHACLYEEEVKKMAERVVSILNMEGCISLERYNKILDEAGAFENDKRAVFHYGVLNKFFKLAPNTFGCMLCACS